MPANGTPRWCNLSVLIADEAKSTTPFTIHVVRPADLQKKFEMLLRDFVLSETSLPSDHVGEILVVKRTPTAMTELTRRELEILRRLSSGASSARIAGELFTSRTTVSNHIQHIMKKLGAHSRLEAVRRAEQSGLI